MIKATPRTPLEWFSAQQCGTESSNHPEGYLEWPGDPDPTEYDTHESRYWASCVQECQTESLTRADAIGLIGEGPARWQ